MRAGDLRSAVAEGQSVGTEEMPVHQRGFGMQGQKYVRMAGADERADEGLSGLLRSHFEVADYVSASLRHPVRFGYQDGATRVEGRIRQQSGNEKNSLASQAADDDLLYSLVHSSKSFIQK